MSTGAPSLTRVALRRLLRVARFESWALDQLEDAIEELYGEGVISQPPAPPDQLAGPASSG